MTSFDSAPVPPPAPSGSGAGPGHGSPAGGSSPMSPGALPPTDVMSRGQAHPEEEVRYGVRVAAAYAWRIMVLAVAVYLVFVVLAKLTLVAVAVFVGLVISALLRPLVDLLSRKVPRALSVAVALLTTIVAIGAIFTFVADSVAGQSTKLSNQFVSGLNEIERSLAGAPFHIRAVDLTQAGQQIRNWVTQNGGSLAGQALGGASVAAEVLTGLALAVFCSVFFLSSGTRIWDWLLDQTAGNSHRWDRSRADRRGWDGDRRRLRHAAVRRRRTAAHHRFWHPPTRRHSPLASHQPRRDHDLPLNPVLLPHPPRWV
jgi:putative heme transporter